ncbi:hypothetical protein GL218_00888 [Daldinia childiae]|uniref:uncharacterized protein n=1 Tax=Daldinia childiae TaxID=326645 RepID=UPI0014463BA1|nr:uncharacterized protein GL218_00888 [Daldinia childiae]KAF3071069.1 hypothetical protein GL218_00888 [Daldinia childiae]
MKLSTKMISRFAKLLQDEYADPCLCYCTPNGCTSASKYVHAFYGEINGISISERAVDGIKLTEAMTGHNLNTVASGLIRVMTFEELGMKHTCCRYRNKRYYSLQEIIEEGLLILMEPAEIEEIREEDRYLAEQLDSLMEEFEAKLQEMGVPLSSFVENCWLPRMEEVKKERDKLSAGESQAMKEIGVVLEES